MAVTPARAVAGKATRRGWRYDPVRDPLRTLAGMSATTKLPNILLITTDQQRFDALGCTCPHGVLRTPTLDALAASGVYFRRAYSTSPVCIPARRSLLSGLHPRTHGLLDYRDGLDWNAPLSLPQLLRERGYQTQLVGKLHLHPQRKRYGYDHMVRCESSNDRWDTPLQPVNDWADWMRAQGYAHPNDIGINGNGRVARPWDKPEHTHLTSWLADHAVDFLTRYRDPSCPFFLHLSFVAPHPPLTPPQAYWQRYFGRHDARPVCGQWAPTSAPRTGIPDDAMTGPFPLAEIQDAMSGYWASIQHIDDRIRYVLTRLCEYGSSRQREPTLIIFTSDHGEMLGDHQLWRKSVAYEGSAHIPLIVAGRNLPDLQTGVCDGLVCLEDVVATLLDRCGGAVPAPLNTNDLDGRSLLPQLHGAATPVRESLYGICRPYHYLVHGEWKYLWFETTGEEQLFHLASDPQECHDRSGDAAQLLPLRQRFAAYVTSYEGIDFDAEACRPCDGRPPRALWPAV